jgi:TRAP-type uncharacterized transport system substrate-binding protein
MKKRILAFLLAVSIAVSVLVLPVSAASINNTALQTAITLGAVPTGQELSANITRGAFAKMLVSFSTYRESVGAQGTVALCTGMCPAPPSGHPISALQCSRAG